MKTPQSRFEQQQRFAQMMGTVEPEAFFRAGVGSDWMLCLAQGIMRLQEYALSVDGAMVITRDQDG